MQTAKQKAVAKRWLARLESGQMLNMLSGIDRTIAIHNGVCTRCEGPAFEFRDDISEREQTRSGFCQDCQDEVFGI